MSNINLGLMCFALLLTYLVASLSSAIIICKALGLADPRNQGSKNPGATNVLRIGGRLPAFFTLVGDVLKALIPVMLIRLYSDSAVWAAITILVAVLGHCFPIYYRFQGGKGVATALGGIFGLSLLAGLATGGSWLLMAYLFRYSSLSSLVALLLAPLYAYVILGDVMVTYPLIGVAVLIFYRHQKNIQNLFLGIESKIGQKR